MKYLTLLVLLLALPLMSHAAKYRYEKSHTTEVNFNVSAYPSLNANVKYADVVVNRHDRNEIKVRIEVKTSSNDEQAAIEMLNIAQHTINKVGNGVNLNATLNNEINTKYNRGRSHVKYRIIYYISLPSNTKMSFTQMYGDIKIDQVTAPLTANVKYGDMRINGSITQTGNYAVWYGDVYINTATAKQTLDVKYGEVKIRNATDVDLSNTYTDVSIDALKTLTCSASYGDLDIGTAGSINITKAMYGDLSIGTLENRINIDALLYSDLEIGTVSHGFTSITIPKAMYSDIKMGISSGFRVEATVRYGDCHVHDISVDDGTIKTTIGNETSSMVKITSSYGDIKIYK